MTTLQEAAMRQSFETWAKPILGDNPTWKESGECELAWQSWKAALAQQELPQKERPDFMAGYDAGMADAKRMTQQGEPVAYITETEQGPMVWTPEMYDEACTYCDDDEFPVPLYTAAPAPQPVHQGERAELIRRLYAIANTESNEVADALNEAADMLQSAQPEDGCAPNHMCNGHRVHIPTGECCNKCGATSW